jgi:hypothetical protein
VKAEKLRPASDAAQLTLDFEDQPARAQAKLATDHAIDALAARFGHDVVRPAALLKSDSARDALDGAGAMPRHKSTT